MKIIAAAVIAAGLATGVMAQTTSSMSHTTTTSTSTDANDSSHNPALKDSHVKTATMAASGANSFTQAQARTRIAKAGYTRVGKLTKDKDGVWMGHAMQNGSKVMVGIDYKGNVTTR